MLRVFHITRLAPNHSPLREQRLLFVDPQDKNAIETPESSNNTPESTAQAEVLKISEVMSKHLSSVTPELLINEMGGKVDIFDALREGNILTNETEALMMQLRGGKKLKETDVFSNEEKEQIVTELLQATKNTVEVARMVEGELKGYEENLALLTQELKRIESNTESTVHDVAQFLSEVQRIREEDGTTPEKVRNRIAVLLGIHHTATFVDEDGKPRNLIIHRILPSIEAIAKYDNRRSSFAKNPTTGDEDDKEAATVLDGFRPAKYREGKIARLREQDKALKEYVESKLQQEGQQIYSSYEQWLKGIEGLTDEETLQTMGVSRAGLYHEYCKNVTSCINVFSKNDEDPSRNLAPLEDENFLTSAASKIEELEGSREKFELAPIRASDDSKDIQLPRFVVEVQASERESLKLGSQIANQMQRLLKRLLKENSRDAYDMMRDLRTSLKDMYGNFASGKTPSLEEQISMRVMNPSVLKKEKESLTLMENNIGLVAKVGEYRRMVTDRLRDNTPENVQKLQNDLEEAELKLPQLLTHGVFGATNTYDFFRGSISKWKTVLQNRDAGQEPLKDSEYASASVEIEKLLKATRELEKWLDPKTVKIIDTKIKFAEKDPTGDGSTKALCHYNDEKIYINREACKDKAQMIEKAIYHEQGHAILHILTDVTNIAPNLYAEFERRIEEEATGNGKNYQDLLTEVGTLWNCSHSSNKVILDEAIVRFADWKNYANPNPKPAELALFRMMERDEVEDERFTKEALEIERKKGKEAARFGGEGYDDATSKEGEDGKQKEEVSARSKLQGLQKKLTRIKNFLEVYPEYITLPAFSSDKINAIEKSLREAEDAFEKGAEETRVLEILATGDNIADNITKIIEGIDAEKKDLTYAEPSTKSTWRQSLFNGVAWMSISDVMILFKEASEDVQRMWKRRGESVRASMGKNLFGLIPESVPYLGQLTKEFRGREQSSEQEEVSVWEKRYTTIDAYTLLNDILPGLTNKDQTKAVVNLLTKKGRMDWNNTNFWDVLERLSVYHMPHLACKRDQILRNQYLQKLIANIWDDKDLFEQWKNDNDSNINSGKSKLGPTIDELSGTRGALEAKLKDLLTKHKKQQAGEYIAKEEEINPHFYEGILLYAMQNGKASMEGKIFYLIQGVANGLISMDRIKGFIGTQGEILNAFPVIDFFNNKTYEEVMEVAKQLGYPGALEPDERTVDFLLDVLRNDQGARQRVQKGMSLVQKWDHEDLPMHVSMLDHKAMNDVIAPVSGSTPKVTIEGMKNIYVGFNSALQYYAIKAKLHKDGISQFTNEDARQCMTTIAAYTNFNNRVSIPAAASQRPTLSWNNINNETAVVSGNNLVKNYRDNMNTFIFGLTTGGGEGKPNLGIPQARDIDMRTFLGIGRNAENTSSDVYTDKKYDGAANVLDSALQAAAVSKKNILIDELAKMAVKQPSAGGFIPENDAYTYEKIKALKLKRKQAASGGAQMAP